MAMVFLMFKTLYSIQRSWRLGLLIASLLLASVLSACTQMFFHPESAHVQTPENLGYRYQDVFVRSEDGGRIHGWLIEPTLEPNESVRGLVYFLHGNAQNISWHILGAQWLLNEGYRVFAIDYRGYGLSSGVANVPQVYFDISAGFDWLQIQNEDEQLPLILFGQSLGASLGVNWLAQHADVQPAFSKVIMDSGFSRFDTVAKEVADSHWLTWLFQYPAKWMLADETDPADGIAQLTLPITIVHSTDDTVVDYVHSDVLLAAGGENVQRVTASGPHISAFRDPAIRETVLAWLAKPNLL